jgi:hypothetical protein
MRIPQVRQGWWVTFTKSQGTLLEKEPVKGYGVFLAVDLETNGHDYMKEGEGERERVQCQS